MSRGLSSISKQPQVLPDHSPLSETLESSLSMGSSETLDDHDPYYYGNDVEGVGVGVGDGDGDVTHHSAGDDDPLDLLPVGSFSYLEGPASEIPHTVIDLSSIDPSGPVDLWDDLPYERPSLHTTWIVADDPSMWDEYLDSGDDAAWEDDVVLESFGEVELVFGAEDPSTSGRTTPVPRALLENLPSVVVGEGKCEEERVVCAICKEDVPVGGTVKKLPCSHLYHQDCIVPWLTTHNTCPLCRHALPTEEARVGEDDRRRGGRG